MMSDSVSAVSSAALLFLLPYTYILMEAVYTGFITTVLSTHKTAAPISVPSIILHFLFHNTDISLFIFFELFCILFLSFSIVFFHLPDEWAIHYTLPFQKEASGKADPLTFHLKPFSFKHTGLFPEQAVNWDWFSGLIHEAGRPVKVLNLFAYTGGATVSAAAAGAAVTHVDASKGMVGWAKENAAASGLADAPIRWLVDDCMKFVEREIRRGNKYDGIIMDPPSYGRGPKGEIWKIEDNIWDFVGLTAQLLSDDALFFLINSYTTGLQPAVLSYMMNSTLTKKFGGHVEAEEIGLPVTESGLVLPCGASGRWQRK